MNKAKANLIRILQNAYSGGPEKDSSDGFAYSGWQNHYSDDVTEAVMMKQMSTPLDLMLGLKTFDIWAPYWPQHADEWTGVKQTAKYVR